MSTILKCTGLTKDFDTVKALDTVNLEIQSGRVVGLLGPNGSGKSTLIKIANGLLTPTSGSITIDGKMIGPETKSIVSYLPERTYLNDWMRVAGIIDFFADFYSDFSREKAKDMLERLNIQPDARLKTLSKGTKEKIQLILVMSRNAKLYLLDEPIAGVDPAARDYILDTILQTYNPEGSIILSTHLIYDVERALDDIIFLLNGKVERFGDADTIRENTGKSIDQLFREVFRC